MGLWEESTSGKGSREAILGLSAPASHYGLENISYIRPSRYYIGTSSGRSYRRCQRKWGFNSSFRLGLEHQGVENNIHFWFGSAIHWALEDYFGWNRFGDPRRALKAYYECFDVDDRPNGAGEHYDLGIGMLEYFLDWHQRHNEMCGFETAWFTHDGGYKLAEPFSEGAFPGTEIEICLDLGIRALVDAKSGSVVGELQYDGYTNSLRITNKSKWASNFSDDIVTPETLNICVEDWNNFDSEFYLQNVGEFSGEHRVKIQPICFHGTCDKIVKDKIGRLWIVDYKTAKGADTNKLDTDDQISRYLWAASQFLGMHIYGFVYLQLTKTVPKMPRVLQSGEISSDKSQKTTHYLYRAALTEKYGAASKAPQKNIACLNALAAQETAEGDSFIRWDMVTRTKEQQEATYYNILAEVREWLNTDKYLLPAPTRDCIWDCNFRDACLALEKGNFSEFDSAIANYGVRIKERDDSEPGWRAKLQWPKERPVGAPTAEELKIIDKSVQLNVVLDSKEEE